MIRGGAKPTRPDHRDFDFHKSFGSVVPPTFPTEYNVDAGLWMPDQNAMALEFGCTGFTQGSLCEDEDGSQYDPAYIYRNTPPYDDGGRDIRASLDFIRKSDLHEYGSVNGFTPGTRRTAYFNVRAYTPLDWFDAIRLAMYSTAQEKRAVSVGTPWFPEFESPDHGKLPVPKSFDVSAATWHNWKICGWKTIGDQVYLIGKSWQGAQYGDNGFCYISRPLTNNLMSISGSAAFTVSKIAPAQIQLVDLTIVQTIVSYIRRLLGL